MLGAGMQFARSRGGEDRFYNPAKARRNRQNQDNLRRAQSDVTASQSPSVTTAFREPENGADKVVEPSKFLAVTPVEPVASSLCNMERFLQSVTPSVPAQYPSKTTIRGWRGSDMEFHLHFVLGDLWESFKEWSAYGAGVPLILNDSDSVVQYYVPYLSGIQLYGNPLKASAKSSRPGEDSDGDYFRDSSSDGSSDYEHERGSLQYSVDSSHLMERLSMKDQQVSLQEGFSSDEGESGSPQGCLLFEYLERDQPYGREPLSDKILDLTRRFPELKSIRSCDLLSSSWISVAWYPIYRIPMGPTLKDLDACFLTFHSLHTPITGTRSVSTPNLVYPSEIDGAPKISLPVFGLASYKFKTSLWTPTGGCERQLVTSLLQAADSWLTMLQVDAPSNILIFGSDLDSRMSSSRCCFKKRKKKKEKMGKIIKRKGK